MRKMIAATCLLMMPSMLLAYTETNPMTPEEIAAARQQIVGEIETQCPDYVQKNREAESVGAPTLRLDEAMGIVGACLDTIGALHQDMIRPPSVSRSSFGCSARYGFGDPNCVSRPGMSINIVFKYEPAGSEASWRQAPLWNILRETFEKRKVLGYESSIWPD